MEYEDTLMFASSFDRVHNILAQPAAWQRFLEQTLTEIQQDNLTSNNIMVSLADELTQFLSKEDNPYILLDILHAAVREVMKADKSIEDYVQLSCPRSPLSK